MAAILFIQYRTIYSNENLPKTKQSLKYFANVTRFCWSGHTGYYLRYRKAQIIVELLLQDGSELQKLITFEDSDRPSTFKDPYNLPAIQMKIVCNEEAGKIVLQFLVSFYSNVCL